MGTMWWQGQCDDWQCDDRDNVMTTMWWQGQCDDRDNVITDNVISSDNEQLTADIPRQIFEKMSRLFIHKCLEFLPYNNSGISKCYFTAHLNQIHNIIRTKQILDLKIFVRLHLNITRHFLQNNVHRLILKWLSSFPWSTSVVTYQHKINSIAVMLVGGQWFFF